MGGVTTASVPDMASRERELNSLYIVTVVVLLVVVTATFGALIFAFWWRSQNDYMWGHLQVPGLLWVTTAILLASSFMLERARSAGKAGQHAQFYRDLQITTGLGVLFLIRARDGVAAGDEFKCCAAEGQAPVVYFFV